MDNLYYHYTSMESCYNIITSRQIWMTDYRFLNDKNELKQAIKLFVSLCDKSHQEALDNAFKWHEFMYYHCVFSFSSSPQILSQWRAYATDGEGVALGFNPQFLEYANLIVVPCVYENQEPYINKIIQKHKKFIENIYEADKRIGALNEFMDWIEKHYENFSALIYDLIPLKSPAFMEEQELRAIKSVKRDIIKRRVRGNLLIPYIAPKFLPDEDSSFINAAIPHIWIGPRSNNLNIVTLTGLGFFVQKYNCGYV